MVNVGADRPIAVGIPTLTIYVMGNVGIPVRAGDSPDVDHVRRHTLSPYKPCRYGNGASAHALGACRQQGQRPS